MKKLFLVSLVAILFAACTNESSETISENGVKTVSLNLGGDFVVNLTRSTPIESAQDIWVFDYVDDELIQTVHKEKGDSNFDRPKITLKHGKHDLYVVVSAGKVHDKIEATNAIIWETIGDTFRGHLNVDINANSGNTLDVTLDRVVAMLNVKSADLMPADAKSIDIKFSKWYFGINYITGEPAGLVINHKMTLTDVNKSAYLDNKMYVFTTKEETKVDLTLDANSVFANVKHIQVYDVPLKANAITVVKGNIFSFSSEGSNESYGMNINLNDTWDTGYGVNW